MRTEIVKALIVEQDYTTGRPKLETLELILNLEAIVMVARPTEEARRYIGATAACQINLCDGKSLLIDRSFEQMQHLMGALQ